MRAHKLCGCIVSCTLDGEERRSERDHEPRVAYCPLHASAPDLLDLLMDIAIEGEQHNHVWLCDHMPRIARAAIRKAKGE